MSCTRPRSCTSSLTCNETRVRLFAYMRNRIWGSWVSIAFKSILLNLIKFFICYNLCFTVPNFKVLPGWFIFRNVLHDPLSTTGFGENQTSEQGQCSHWVRSVFSIIRFRIWNYNTLLLLQESLQSFLPY